MSNLNIIYALRKGGDMAAGALYALGHDDLARRAESEFQAVDALTDRLKEMERALNRDYPYDPLDCLRGGTENTLADIPAERLKEIEEVKLWLANATAARTTIRAEIDAIIGALYDDATISAEEGMLP